MAGAFVVLPHRERRTPQRLGLFPLECLALELLGEVGGDHLEDPAAQDPQRLRVVVGGQLDQVRLGGRALLGRDRELAGARQPVQGGDDRAGLGEVDPPGGHRRREDVMLLELLGEAEVGAGLAAYLPGLDRHPVRRGAGTGLDGGLGCVRRRRAAAGRARRAAPGPGQGSPGRRACPPAASTSAALGQGVEARDQPLGEVEHRVEVVDRLAAHGSIQAPSTDRKVPLTCGFVQIARPVLVCWRRWVVVWFSTYGIGLVCPLAALVARPPVVPIASRTTCGPARESALGNLVPGAKTGQACTKSYRRVCSSRAIVAPR